MCIAADEPVANGRLRSTSDQRCTSVPEEDAMTVTADRTPLDEAKIEEFAGRMFGTYTSAMLTYMIDLGNRTGLFETLAAGPGTSEELAGRAGLTERYVREWLGAVTTGGIVTYDPSSRTYTLPAEHAVCLTGDGSLNVAGPSQMVTLFGQYVGEVAAAFRDGGGVPYERYRPAFTGAMDAANRGTFDGQLIDGILPLAGGLPARLSEGIRVADIGCGTGHAINLMGRAYPASTFVGYDFSGDAIEQARAEARAWGLSNVSFELVDVAELPADPTFDAIVAFDAIHDQAEPARVLSRIRHALADSGVFVMMDVKASSLLERNIGSPMAPLLYSTSTLHCLTVSLAYGGTGLGTVWGEELARQMLADAGFTHVEVHDVPDEPVNCLYVAR
jgi:2-polyprenyl-3-methyl-5-hydroxy-6-metoxy-1,4-benzoquinol methylase